MKKPCFLFVAITVISSVLFCGCGGDEPNRISERRSEYLVASDGEYTVTAVSGVRENPFTADGNVGAIKPYTLITLAPKNFDIDAIYTYVAEYGGATYGGTLAVHPFAASFSAEFDAEVKSEFSLTVECGGVRNGYKLKSLVVPDMIDCDLAIDVAKTSLKPSGAYEIRARLIKNPLGADGLCWHVSFCAADYQSSVLLDPYTAKTLAKKQNSLS